jgi:hypothetical protein
VPKDIFDIIEEAPAKAEVKEAPGPPRLAPEKIAMPAEPEESMFEVEPEYEVEPELEPEQPASPEMPKPATVSAAPAPARDDDWAAMAAEAEAARAAAAAAQSAPPAVEPPSAEPEGFDTEQIFGKEPMPAEEAPAFEPALGAEMPSPEPAAPPSFDFSEPLPAEAEGALPIGQKAMEEMRAGLGLGEEAVSATSRHPDIVSFESLDMASRASHEDYSFSPPDEGFGAPVAEAVPAPLAPPAAGRAAAAPLPAPAIPEEMLRGVARESLEKAMREVLERVAWEIIPDLAERLIREEIERLKAEK